MIDPKWIALVFFLCLGVAGLCICISAIYYFKMMRCYKRDLRWGRSFAPSLFIGEFFTAEGNVYRRRMLWASGAFLGAVSGAVLLPELLRCF